MHMPHAVQSLASITISPDAPARIANSGHISAHTPQPAPQPHFKQRAASAATSQSFAGAL